MLKECRWQARSSHCRACSARSYEPDGRWPPSGRRKVNRLLFGESRCCDNSASDQPVRKPSDRTENSQHACERARASIIRRLRRRHSPARPGAQRVGFVGRSRSYQRPFSPHTLIAPARRVVIHRGNGRWRCFKTPADPSPPDIAVSTLCSPRYRLWSSRIRFRPYSPPNRGGKRCTYAGVAENCAGGPIAVIRPSEG